MITFEDGKLKIDATLTREDNAALVIFAQHIRRTAEDNTHGDIVREMEAIYVEVQKDAEKNMEDYDRTQAFLSGFRTAISALKSMENK